MYRSNSIAMFPPGPRCSWQHVPSNLPLQIDFRRCLELEHQVNLEIRSLSLCMAMSLSDSLCLFRPLFGLRWRDPVLSQLSDSLSFLKLTLRTSIMVQSITSPMSEPGRRWAGGRQGRKTKPPQDRTIIEDMSCIEFFDLCLTMGRSPRGASHVTVTAEPSNQAQTLKQLQLVLSFESEWNVCNLELYRCQQPAEINH